MKTKQEKQQEEQLKPIKEQKYWSLSKADKDVWLEHHNMNRFIDIVFPMIEIGLCVLIFILLLCSVILVKGSSLAAVIISFILFIPLVFFLIYTMYKNKRGVFICRHWRLQKEIKEAKKTQPKDFEGVDLNSPLPAPKTDNSDLEL